ncbi:MAG: adenylate/guanylate cyclase domain-containing protein [Deltaproteobacteria bacterium]
MSSESTIARLATARQNEDQVLAEGSLEAERVVGWVRLALIAVLASSGLALSIVTGHPHPPDLWRNLVAGSYFVLAAGNVLVTRLKRPNVGMSNFGPIAFNLIDFGALTFFHVRMYRGTHDPTLAVAAVIDALVICFSVGRRRAWHAVIACVVACLCFAFIAFTEMAGNAALARVVLVCAVYVALTLLILATQTRVRRMFLGLRRRENLTRFLPAAVAEELVRHGEAALEPTQREVTILFSDIRDFTRLSEHLPPRLVLELLDGYFADMAQIVHGHGGIVAKFIGDGMMAVWGAPERLPDHAGAALAAALDMRRKLAERNAERARLGHSPLRIGIGIHTGTVAAGMLGGSEQHEYTVIGDAVNLASRVEGLTKAHAVDILATEATWQAAEGRFVGVQVGTDAVKGRDARVVVYRVDGRTEPSAAAAATG